jgi:hypothetical protein
MTNGFERRFCRSLERLYVFFKDNNIKIREEYQWLWSLNPIETYVPKLGYITLVEEGLEG